MRGFPLVSSLLKAFIEYPFLLALAILIVYLSERDKTSALSAPRLLDEVVTLANNEKGKSINSKLKHRKHRLKWVNILLQWDIFIFFLLISK